MNKTVEQQKQYTHLKGNYQLPLPLDFESSIAADDSVRLLSHVLEELDYTKLYQAYSQKGRKPGVEPSILFKVIIYAFMEGIYSTRHIERSCKRDINFKWLLQGYPSPDHSTIARFIKDYLSTCFDDLFNQFIHYLNHIEEINFEHLFVDGTKIEANANKYTFVWKKAINKNEAKLQLKIETLINTLNQNYLSSVSFDKNQPVESLEKALDFLKAKQQESNIVFVHGIGKRKTILQKLVEQMEECLERQKKYDASHAILKDRNSYSKTDPDATFMHMKDDHMRNAQLKPGYNIQIGVESEYITGVNVYTDHADTTTLIPFLENMYQGLGVRYQNIIADAGYESEENYIYLEQQKQEPYIKPVMYEKWKKKSFKKDISKRENMHYNAEEDYYICANHKRLQAKGLIHRTSASGYQAEITVYECEDCSNCTLKEKCTRAKGNRKMQISKPFITKRQHSYENIKTELGTQLRMNRSIQVEGAFGVIKWDHEFNRFLRRGKNNVKTEFMLLCLAYNVRKLHSKIQSDRCKNHLHPLKTA